MKKNKQTVLGLNTKEILRETLRKLSPMAQKNNYVMGLVYLSAISLTFLWIKTLIEGQTTSFYLGSLALWLCLTVIFSAFSESVADARAKAQAQSLREINLETKVKKIKGFQKLRFDIESASIESVCADTLRKGDYIYLEDMSLIPNDGEIIIGSAMIDESAMTGESAPVLRESGGDFSSVTGGTKVLTGKLVVQVLNNPGQGFVDQMIAMIEGASRRKTPNEAALSLLLNTVTTLFLFVVIGLGFYSSYAVSINHQGEVISVATLLALLVCLIPTTISGLLPAIGIAGMTRVLSHNVIAKSGRAVESAGDIDILILDKTGTITYGNRQASQFFPLTKIDEKKLFEIAYLSAVVDETPEGKSIVDLALRHYSAFKAIDITQALSIPFTPETQMSGTTIGKTQYRKGSLSAVERLMKAQSKTLPKSLKKKTDEIAAKGSTPLVLLKDGEPLGLIELKDVIKPGISDEFANLRRLGIKTVMVTGDNQLTAAAIAAEAGVDDFVAESNPSSKLEIIRKYQKEGFRVAMTGDGTNDAPALAQADVALAMNSGTVAAKEAANMIDLDSSPTKLISIVQVGKALLMTRGALTTFLLANDIAKYFVVIPLVFVASYPSLESLNVIGLSSSESAILSAVIFNALIIVFLIPLALKGVQTKAKNSNQLLAKNLLIFGFGGALVPFIGIKVIDLLLAALGVL